MTCMRDVTCDTPWNDWRSTSSGGLNPVGPGFSGSWGLEQAYLAGAGRRPRSVIQFPTQSGIMTTVDSRGRIVLPQEVRERLGMTPGTEVEVREEGGKAVIEPEDDPERIIERMEQLVEEASSARGETAPLDAAANPIARAHRSAVRRGTENATDE